MTNQDVTRKEFVLKFYKQTPKKSVWHLVATFKATWRSSPLLAKVGQWENSSADAQRIDQVGQVSGRLERKPQNVQIKQSLQYKTRALTYDKNIIPVCRTPLSFFLPHLAYLPAQSQRIQINVLIIFIWTACKSSGSKKKKKAMYFDQNKWWALYIYYIYCE